MFALERLRALLDDGDLDHDGLKGTANEQTSGHEKVQAAQVIHRVDFASTAFRTNLTADSDIDGVLEHYAVA